MQEQLFGRGKDREAKCEMARYAMRYRRVHAREADLFDEVFRKQQTQDRLMIYLLVTKYL